MLTAKIISLAFLMYCGYSLIGTAVDLESGDVLTLDVPEKSERRLKIQNIDNIDELRSLLLKSDDAFDSMLSYALASRDVLHGVKRNNKAISSVIFLAMLMMGLGEICERRK